MIRAKTLMSAFATALVAACSSDDDKASRQRRLSRRRQNILFFLGDGMGITTLTAARIYKVGEDGDRPSTRCRKRRLSIRTRTMPR